MSTTGHFSAGFLHIFTIFSIFGLAPYKLTANGCREDRKYLICSMLALVLIPGPYCYLLIKQESDLKSLVDSFIISLFVKLAYVAYVTSGFHLLLTMMLQRRKVMTILNNFVKFDKSSGCTSKTSAELKRIVIGALAFGAFAAPSVLSGLERYGFDTLSDILLILVIFGMEMTKYFFVGQYVLLLDVLKKKFQLLRFKLIQQENCKVSKPNVLLSAIQNLYHELWEVSQSFSVFSEMILMQVLTGILWIVAFAYILIACLIKSEKSAYAFLLHVAVFVGQIGKLLVLIYSCVSTKKEALKIPETLHRIGRNFEDSKVVIFSLQLVHEQVSFTAGGSIEIDENLLYSIFGVACTYLMIILQFEISSLPTTN